VLCNDTKFNDAEVRDHVYTIVAAGSETTALQTAHTSKEFKSSLNHLTDLICLSTCAVILLATNPEIQERAYEELKEVFPSDDVEVSYDNISKLDYLERIIKESLRLCPVVPSKFSS